MIKKGNGGYALIDLSGTDLLAGSKVTIAGIYGTVDKAMSSNKPVIACNVVNGSNNPVTPTPVSITKNSDDIEATLGVNKITIDKNNGVVVSSLVTGANRTTAKKS